MKRGIRLNTPLRTITTKNQPYSTSKKVLSHISSSQKVCFHRKHEKLKNHLLNYAAMIFFLRDHSFHNAT